MSKPNALLVEAMFKAQYYRWAAQRGQCLAGNDPITGQPRDQGIAKVCGGAAESYVAYKAMAQYWHGQVKKIQGFKQVWI